MPGYAVVFFPIRIVSSQEQTRRTGEHEAPDAGRWRAIGFGAALTELADLRVGAAGAALPSDLAQQKRARDRRGDLSQLSSAHLRQVELPGDGPDGPPVDTRPPLDVVVEPPCPLL